MSALATAATACGGSAVRSGASVGGLGNGLAQYSDSTPHSAEVCALEESFAAPNSGFEKSITETCAKAQKNDQLYRRAFRTLSLYGQSLASVSQGEEAETAGKLEAAASGVTGPDWSDAEDQATRDAVAQLVTLLGAKTEDTKVNLNKLVQDAAPSVAALCTSLGTYLDGQASKLAAIRGGVDNKSTTKSIRRCGTLDTRSVCVQDSVVDRMVYAGVFARAVSLENSTHEAKSGLERFCVAHEKLAEAAKNDKLEEKETYQAVVEAVKAVQQSQAEWNAAPAAAAK